MLVLSVEIFVEKSREKIRGRGHIGLP